MRLILVAVALASVVVAQAPTIISIDNFGHSGGQTQHNVVRDSAGVLYLATIEEVTPGTRTIVIYASYNEGLSWNTYLPNGINDASSGESGSFLSASLNIAIDDQDVIHIHFSTHAYPSYYQSYYRTFTPITFAISPIVNINTMLGIAATSRNTANQVAIAPDGTVWLNAPTTTLWREQLLRSNVPYATTGAFTSVGPISVSASSQSTRMAIDAFGNVHCVYYENTGTGDFRHRMFDVSTNTWSVATNLGNLVAPNDILGTVSCDYLGNTHMLCLQDGGGAAGTNAPKLVYYVRDAFGVFSAPITIMSATPAQLGTSSVQAFAMSVNENTGDCHVVYRDFAAGGQLAIVWKGLFDTSFTHKSVVRPPDTGQHFYYNMATNGALFPANANSNGVLHMSFRELSVAPHLFRYARLDTNKPLAVFQEPTVSPGSTVMVTFKAPGLASHLYIPAVSCTPGAEAVPATSLLFPLMADFAFQYYFSHPFALGVFQLAGPGSYFGVLDSFGEAQGFINIPPSVPPGIDLPLHVAFVTAPIGGGTVNAVSEPGTVVIR